LRQNFPKKIFRRMAQGAATPACKASENNYIADSSNNDRKKKPEPGARVGIVGLPGKL
jgi:hypothetical protein